MIISTSKLESLRDPTIRPEFARQEPAERIAQR
jgi:hypothetical protein